jgi:hypothetical protein
METEMTRSQLSFGMMGFVLASPVLGFSAGHYLSYLLSPETAPTTLTWPAPAQPNRIYCENGTGGQYSNVHHGWVCLTERKPAPEN